MSNKAKTKIELFRAIPYLNYVHGRGFQGRPVLIFEKSEYGEHPWHLPIRVAIARFIANTLLKTQPNISIQFTNKPRIPPFTYEEIDRIKTTVAKFDDLEIYESWNGVGCYWFSIATAELPEWLKSISDMPLKSTSQKKSIQLLRKPCLKTF
jgi:hypothetical protein